jgi:flap endonuclease-1
MGIYLLHTFLKRQCKDVVQKKHFIQLKNKRVAVDTSIYLYLFSQENRLLENFYDLCSTFYIHKITPIFIFDGKPDEDKKDELALRKEKKQNAEKEYTELIEYLKQRDNNEELEMYEKKLNALKKQFLRIHTYHIRKVKSLITAFGMMYIDAPSESDALCSYLCVNNIVDACISEDTDMFVYGCPTIYRGLDLKTNSVFVYTNTSIMKHLNIEFPNFQMLCLLCDNDYYKTGNTMFSIYKKYKQYIEKYKKDDYSIIREDFVKKYQKHGNIDDYFNVYDKYNISKYKNSFVEYDSLKIQNTNYDKEQITKIMKKCKFYFV